MRVERLVIEAGENTLTLDLHPRLTVVAGMGQVERESLVGEVIGALGRQPPGPPPRARGAQRPPPRPVPAHHRPPSHRRRRPRPRRHRRVHRRRRRLQHARHARRSTPAAARRVMRFGAADLATSSDRGKAVEVLAGLDQRRVWTLAESLRQAEGDLTSEAEAIGSAPEDAAMIDEVEARHIAVERAADQFESTRKRTFWIGGACALATIPGVGGRRRRWACCSPSSPPASVAASLLARARVGRAAKAEERGARRCRRQQLPRLPAPAGQRPPRQRLQPQGPHGRGRRPPRRAQPSGSRSPATSRWSGRFANREEIQAASRLRREVDALGRAVRHRPRHVRGLHRRAGPRAREPPGRGPLRRRRGRAAPARRPVPAARPVGEAAAARAARPLGRRAADRVPHRGRGRGLLGPPRGAHRRGGPHRAGPRERRRCRARRPRSPIQPRSARAPG